MNLAELFDKYGSDKGKLGYGPVYDEYFFPIKDKPIKLLELGVWSGGSLRAWQEYFPSAQIIGVDEVCHPTDLPERITLETGKQEDTIFLDRLITAYGAFDVVIDDCGHFWQPQQISFETLWPAVSPGGLYIIEDLGTSFNDYYRQEHDLSTVDFLTEYVPAVTGDEARIYDMEFIHFYPNQAVMKKR